ncbi:MAG: hypothetical protein V1835_06940 [Candidatus Micrarchaeota archaeon]
MAEEIEHPLFKRDLIPNYGSIKGTILSTTRKYLVEKGPDGKSLVTRIKEGEFHKGTELDAGKLDAELERFRADATVHGRESGILERKMIGAVTYWLHSGDANLHPRVTDVLIHLIGRVPADHYKPNWKEKLKQTWTALHYTFKDDIENGGSLYTGKPYEVSAKHYQLTMKKLEALSR